MGFPCKQKVSVIIFLVLLVGHASGQPKCKVEYYSTEQGLSHQAVTAIIKDKEGFMWFGSWDGINRFDGHSFVSYKSSPGDKSQLGNDRIDRIVEDQSDHLWIQAYDRQVYRFDKKTEQFLPLSTVVNASNKKKAAFSNILAASNKWVWLQSVNEGLFCVPQTDLSSGRFYQYNKDAAEDFRLPSNKVNFFHEDRKQRLWVGTPKGLCCLQPTSAGIYKNKKIASGKIAAGANFISFDEDVSCLYFGTEEGELIVFDKRTNAFSIHKISAGALNAVLRSKKGDIVYATSLGEIIAFHLKDQGISKKTYSTSENLYSIYEDQSGVLWIEPEKLGVIRFDPIRQIFNSYSQKVEDPNNAIGNRFKVFEDNSGLVWVNMKGGGFGYYNKAKSSVDYLLNASNGSSYQMPGIIYNSYYDSSGILWLRVYGRELVKIIFQGNGFNQEQLVDAGAGFATKEIRGLLCDDKGRLWLGAKSGKLYIREKDKSITGLFINEPAEGLGQVYSMLQDRRKNIWLATKRNGLFKATPVDKEETKYKLTNYLADENIGSRLPSNQIYSLLEDQQGRIWIGTFDKGLVLAVGDGDSIKFVHTGDAFKNYPKETFQKIRHMALDGDGNIWIATTDGLLLLDANDQHSPVYRYKTYSKIPGDKESLGNNDIQFVHRDAKNRVWLATSGGGFCQAIGDKPFQSLRFRNYTTKDGLPNDYILSCAEDRQGNLWLATENGLSKFNPETKVFRNYDSYDGLPKVGFSEAAAGKQFSNGRLVFGTTDGYVSFDPDSISSSRIATNIAFTNLQINNENAGPEGNDAFLKEGINYVSDLALKYNQNIISIDYAILDYRAGNKQAFAYRLVGFDSTWHDDRQLRRATYTNLPPGHYLFEVKSLSTDLYSNVPYKRLAITILPPPWKTWWAYTLYVLCIGVISYFIWRYAVAMIRLRNKIAVEQKLAALKLNFFTNVSHELRTPLTLIVSPLEQVAKKEKLSAEGASYIDVARKNAARMVRFVNQLLDLRKVQSDKAILRISRVEIISFVRKISDHFTEAARSKRLKLEVSSEEKDVIAWVDAEKLDVVIYNLLGNAIKFTPEGKTIRIIIQSIPAENSFSISVYDQGIGVPTEKLEDIFDLFHEGENSAARDLKGTGIGLALSKEFVNLHGGKIWAANNEHGGLTVTVKLKLGSEHYEKDGVSFVDAPKISIVHETPIEQQLLPQPAYTSLPKDQQVPLVLLVEDNDELRSFTKAQLGEFYRVETANDGEEGLQKAASLMPDLIVSDIMMPKMDGIQMLDKIKNSVNTSHIPVVLLSAKYSIESQIEGLQYGADYYITKPFNSEFLVASINNLLRQRKNLFELLVSKKQKVELSPEALVITSKDELFLKEVIKIVESKMADVEFNIEAVAEEMAMSRTTFYKKFKSLAGLAPVEFVREMRLQRAKQLLDAGGNNVSEVAYTVGFSSPKYFSTCFKDKYQVSPSEYVKSKMH
jgi:signal transduction histidine kinase/ligand-binding sensor domain-containing protein/DNA-binding response OmpR family regulator